MTTGKLKERVGRKEGTFTVFEDWSRKRISAQDLKYYLINAASCIHTENNQRAPRRIFNYFVNSCIVNPIEFTNKSHWN